MMSALISDVIEGTITPGVANAAVNAGGKLLKVVELEMRYGSTVPNGTKELILCKDDKKQEMERIRQMRAELEQREKALLEGGKSDVEPTGP